MWFSGDDQYTNNFCLLSEPAWLWDSFFWGANKKGDWKQSICLSYDDPDIIIWPFTNWPSPFCYVMISMMIIICDRLLFTSPHIELAPPLCLLLLQILMVPVTRKHSSHQNTYSLYNSSPSTLQRLPFKWCWYEALGEDFTKWVLMVARENQRLKKRWKYKPCLSSSIQFLSCLFVLVRINAASSWR